MQVLVLYRLILRIQSLLLILPCRPRISYGVHLKGQYGTGMIQLQILVDAGAILRIGAVTVCKLLNISSGQF